MRIRGPYLFDGTLGSNLLMPLMTAPQEAEHGGQAALGGTLNEAKKHRQLVWTALEADWLDPSLAGLEDSARDPRPGGSILFEAMGIDDFMFRRMLSSHYGARGDMHSALAADDHRLARRRCWTRLHRTRAWTHISTVS